MNRVLLYDINESPQTGGKALHVITDLQADDVLCDFNAKQVLGSPNHLSLQVDEQQHILLDPDVLQYINHSCAPNVYFDTDNLTIVTLRAIRKGEELTFFYPSTEWSMAQGFRCVCGSQNCLQYIKGAEFLSHNILRRYRLANHIMRKISL